MIKDFEIENIYKVIDNLKKYWYAKTEEERIEAIKEIFKLDRVVFDLLQTGKYAADDLAFKLKLATKLDSYRPKNLPISVFAFSPDLYYMEGKFSTFNRGLSRAYKTKAHDKLPEMFQKATANISILKKKYAKEWLEIMQKNNDLVVKAQNASPDKVTAAYTELIATMSRDFCAENSCLILTEVITDWSQAEHKPEQSALDDSLGYHQPLYTIFFPKNCTKAVEDKMMQEFQKDPDSYPHAAKISKVYINLGLIKKYYPVAEEFFSKMMGCLVHEMQHALDYQHPNKTALGAQLEYIDRKTSGKTVQYKDVATENNSYAIQAEFEKMLAKQSFKTL
ncbi:MAG: hypothetical protein IKZ34_01375 [Alphaproteobacteria bacterium]|nr:hypothetical protein [Alphaproteobacteria bacterium]